MGPTGLRILCGGLAPPVEAGDCYPMVPFAVPLSTRQDVQWGHHSAASETPVDIPSRALKAAFGTTTRRPILMVGMSPRRAAA